MESKREIEERKKYLCQKTEDQINRGTVVCCLIWNIPAFIISVFKIWFLPYRMWNDTVRSLSHTIMRCVVQKPNRRCKKTKHFILSEASFDPATCGLWDHHASAAPLWYLWYSCRLVIYVTFVQFYEPVSSALSTCVLAIVRGTEVHTHVSRASNLDLAAYFCHSRELVHTPHTQKWGTPVREGKVVAAFFKNKFTVCEVYIIFPFYSWHLYYQLQCFYSCLLYPADLAELTKRRAYFWVGTRISTTRRMLWGQEVHLS